MTLETATTTTATTAVEADTATTTTTSITAAAAGPSVFCSNPSTRKAEMECHFISDINNLGVTLLDMGKLAVAYDLFRTTLQYTMGEVTISQAVRTYNRARYTHKIPSSACYPYGRRNRNNGGDDDQDDDDSDTYIENEDDINDFDSLNDESYFDDFMVDGNIIVDDASFDDDSRAVVDVTTAPSIDGSPPPTETDETSNIVRNEICGDACIKPQRRLVDEGVSNDEVNNVQVDNEEQEVNDVQVDEDRVNAATLPDETALRRRLNDDEEKNKKASLASASSAPFIHSKGINIIPSTTAYSPDFIVNSAIVSSIIVFNLAVVYHLVAYDFNNSNNMKVTSSMSSLKHYLTKARSLYLKCQLLLRSAGIPEYVTSGNPVIDMVGMAILNNMAQSSFEMSQYDESKQYFDYLVHFALTVIPANYGDPLVGSIIDQQRSSFLLNAIILQIPKLAAAA